MSKRRKFPPIVRKIGSAAFCDNGAMIELDKIANALDADRSAGFADPNDLEVDGLVFGDDNGEVDPDLIARHPALNALLTVEMS